MFAESQLIAIVKKRKVFFTILDAQKLLPTSRLPKGQLMIHPHQRKRDVKRLLGQIGAEILQLQNQLRAIPRSDHTRKQDRELLQDTIDDKDVARRMLQEELRTLEPRL